MKETAAGLADHPLRTSSLISASNFTWLSPIRSCVLPASHTTLYQADAARHHPFG
jgi:hypothetical protein